MRSGGEMPEKLPEPEYPMHDLVHVVRKNGDVVLRKRERFFLSTVLAGELVGMREIDDGCWLVSFMQLDLGHYDARSKRFTASGTEPEEATATKLRDLDLREENLRRVSPISPV